MSQKLISKATEYSYLSPWLGNCMFLTTGKQPPLTHSQMKLVDENHKSCLYRNFRMTGVRWKNRRRLLTPAFHFQILNSFMDVFNDKSLECARLLENTIEEHGGNEFDVFPHMTQCALDIICGN